MQGYDVKICNTNAQLLQATIRGNFNADKIILFVHGLDTNRSGGYNLFEDIEDAVANHALCVRFDQTGHGESSYGQPVSILKSVGDLVAVHRYVKRHWPDKEVIGLGHSMGTLVLGEALLNGISQYVLLCPPSPNPKDTVHLIQTWGDLGQLGVTLAPEFFDQLQAANPVALYQGLAKTASIKILRPLHDKLVGSKLTTAYHDIAEQNLQVADLPGRHNLQQPARQQAVDLIANTLVPEMKSRPVPVASKLPVVSAAHMTRQP